MEHDLTTLSTEIDAEYNLAIPLIHSTTRLGDLLPENENMSTADDGLMRISFREDSIAEILSDSLLVIENQESTLEEFTVGEIAIPAFTSNVTIVMGDLTSNLDPTISSQISEAIDSILAIELLSDSSSGVL